MKRKRETDRSALFGSAMICSLLANIHRDQKARPNPFTEQDFLPKEQADLPYADMRRVLDDLKQEKDDGATG